MKKVFLSTIVNKEESDVKVVAFETQADAVRYNALVALKMAREVNDEDPDEDSQELLDELQLAYDNEDFDEFSSQFEGSFIDDLWSLDVSEVDVLPDGSRVPEGEMPSYN